MRNRRRRRILCDVDGVLSDFLSHIQQWIESMYDLRPGELRDLPVEGWDILPQYAAHVSVPTEHLHRIVSTYMFCLDMPLMPGAYEMFGQLQELGDVHIVTTAWESRHWHAERLEWLKNHFGVDRTRVTYTHDKAYVRGDVLIDDHPKHVFEWSDVCREAGDPCLPILVTHTSATRAELNMSPYAQRRSDVNIATTLDGVVPLVRAFLQE